MLGDHPKDDLPREDASAKEEPRTLRWFRFRLRSLVIFVTVIAVCFGVYQAMVAPYLEQARIRRVILDAGFTCETEPAPWLLSVFAGRDNACIVTKVDLRCARRPNGYQLIRPGDLVPYNHIFEEKFGQGMPLLNRTDELYVDEELLRKVGRLTDLEALNVDAQNVTDDILASWHRLTKLKRLVLAETLVQDPARWPDFPLQTLDVSATMLRDAQISALSKYDSLEELNLSMTPITDDGVKELQRMPNLRQLWLMETAVTVDSCETLNVFPRLDLLEVGDLHADLAMEGAFNKLHSPITVTGGRTTGDGVQCARNEEGLAAARADLIKAAEEFVPPRDIPLLFWVDFDPELWLQVDPLQVNCLDAIAGYENVTNLVFQSSVPQIQAARLPEFPNLSTVSFNKAPLSDRCLEYVADCPSLEALDLHNTSVTDADIQWLANCPSLRLLDISGTQVTDTGLRHVAQINCLEVLHLHGSEITEAGFAALAGHPRL